MAAAETGDLLSHPAKARGWLRVTSLLTVLSVFALVVALLAFARAPASAADLAETVLVDGAPRVRALLVVDPGRSTEARR